MTSLLSECVAGKSSVTALLSNRSKSILPSFPPHRTPSSPFSKFTPFHWKMHFPTLIYVWKTSPEQYPTTILSTAPLPQLLLRCCLAFTQLSWKQKNIKLEAYWFLDINNLARSHSYSVALDHEPILSIVYRVDSLSRVTLFLYNHCDHLSPCHVYYWLC